MASTSSTPSFVRFASRAALAALCAAGAVTVRDQRADACGWSAPMIEELTTFDPAVAGEPGSPSLQFDPYYAGFGGACDDCARTAMLADWKGYLGAGVPDDALARLVYEASVDDLTRLATAKGKGPLGLEPSRWKVKGKGKLERALAYLRLARRVEALSAIDAPGLSPAESAALLAEARAGATGKEPFLAQRYAFQTIRILFYQHDWPGVIDLFDKGKAPLARPSADLAARARYYVAGALRRTGKLARANLELARVHVASTALAPAAAQDFQPMEEADWREALRLAGTPREQAQLWRMVGLTKDGLVAAQEIARLEPTSNLLGLLLVRELSKAESHGADGWGAAPGAAEVAARNRTLTTLGGLAASLATTPRVDRPWLLHLVAGHAAARRGDLATARAQLALAQKAKAGDARVAAQARASLALALSTSGKLDPAGEDELARTMNALAPDFGRKDALVSEVRASLARSLAQAGRVVDAEYLWPGTAPATSWADAAFIQQMIGRAGKTSTAFDRFLLTSPLSRSGLEQDLALRQLLDGNFAVAARTFATTTAASSQLGTDPFVTHIVDCHDCDHETYATAPWTHASFAARLAELERQAGGKGDKAAEAALAIGNALYNVTWYGNARVVLEAGHHATRDTARAERWYKKAYELATSRELKARAAFLAAKAELMQLVTAKYEPYDWVETLPVPTRWFPVVKLYADTAYHKEILAECGHYAGWARRK